MTIKQMLKAVNSFITMNLLEVTNPDMEYVERLGLVVKAMNEDESVYNCFTKMFENRRVCNVMINWIDARY